MDHNYDIYLGDLDNVGAVLDDRLMKTLRRLCWALSQNAETNLGSIDGVWYDFCLSHCLHDFLRPRIRLLGTTLAVAKNGFIEHLEIGNRSKAFRLTW